MFANLGFFYHVPSIDTKSYHLSFLFIRGLRMIRELQMPQDSPSRAASVLKLGRVGHFVHLVPTASMTIAEPHQHQTTISPPAPISTLHQLFHFLKLPYPATRSAQPQDARHHSRDAVSRHSQRLSRAARASLRSRSLWPPGEGHTETCSWCSSRTERWQERACVQQLRWYVPRNFTLPAQVARICSSGEQQAD